MERRLKEVKMGGCKLLVNVARFAAENKMENRRPKSIGAQGQLMTGFGGGEHKAQGNTPLVQNWNVVQGYAGWKTIG
ncbi:hypothetical protein Hanom_Chr01g00037361 [Helianthus anomalus]